MSEKRVFSKELWMKDRAYAEEEADDFVFPNQCDGLTAEECITLSYDFDDYDLKHCFREVGEQSSPMMAKRNLGEQWVEELGWKRHMVKAVEGPCEKCDISHTCNLSADCHMERGLIAKDLGILNEEGCLPSAWDKALYPQVYRTTETIWYAHAESYGIFMEAKGKTKQEAIDAWNRRA